MEELEELIKFISSDPELQNGNTGFYLDEVFPRPVNASKQMRGGRRWRGSGAAWVEKCNYLRHHLFTLEVLGLVKSMRIGTRLRYSFLPCTYDFLRERYKIVSTKESETSDL